MTRRPLPFCLASIATFAPSVSASFRRAARRRDPRGARRASLAPCPDARDDGRAARCRAPRVPARRRAPRPPSARRAGEPEERARMSHVELARHQVFLDGLRELAQAQQVGDRAARAADRLRHRVVRQSEFVDEPREAVRLLERIQVLALDVLDEPDRERRGIRTPPSRAPALPSVRRAAPRASGARRR